VEEEDEEEENEQEMEPSFAETYEALWKVKAFFYAQSGSDADHGHILGFEKSYFQLRQNSAKKQMIMCAFLLKSSFFNVVYSGKQYFPRLSFSRIHRFFPPVPWKTMDRGSTVYIKRKYTQNRYTLRNV
jgi:hypothetical protein